MIREKVLVSDFNQISEEYNYFVWHFISKVEIRYEIFSYFKEPNVNQIHPLREVLDQIDIPYFESYTQDSIDFILNTGVINQGLLYKNGIYSPVFMGFNKRAKTLSTLDNVCYCTQGIIDIIVKTLPLSVKEKYLK